MEKEETNSVCPVKGRSHWQKNEHLATSTYFSTEKHFSLGCVLHFAHMIPYLCKCLEERESIFMSNQLSAKDNLFEEK